MRVAHGLPPPAPVDIRVDRAALNRTGPDERHFNDDVVERARADARKGGHLCARFHLKHANRVGSAQQVIDPRIFLVDIVQVQWLAIGRQHPALGQFAKRNA